MTSYLIAISEEQRLALVELVRASNADRTDAPLEYWEAMLTGLPKEEAEAPRCVHGFCL